MIKDFIFSLQQMFIGHITTAYSEKKFLMCSNPIIVKIMMLNDKV